MALDITAAQIVTRVLNLVVGIGVVIAAGVGGWFAYKFWQYKYECWIYTKRAGGQSNLEVRKGGYFKLKGDAWIFRMRGIKAIIKPPANKFIWKRGRKSVIHLRNLGENQFIPFNPTFSEGKEADYLQRVNYDENMSWHLAMVSLVREKLSVEEFWVKYGNLVVIFASIVMCIVAIYLTYKYASAGLGDIRGLTSAIQDIVQQRAGGAP